MSLPRRTSHAVVVSLFLLAAPAAHGQFNVPLPKPIAAPRVFREDMQMLFHGELIAGDYSFRVESLRSLAKAANLAKAEKGASAKTRLDSLASDFCTDRFGTGELGEARAQCLAALQPDSILKRFGQADSSNAPLRITYVWSPIPGYYTSRPYIAEYLRESGGGDAFSIASKFAANVGEKEAYVVTSLVRGLLGRFIFSADQAMVVARSDTTDPAKRKAIEGERANIIRAVNNGGTLVGRLTAPIYARSGSTMVSAVGLSASGGIIGPVTGDSAVRTGAGSVALEGVASFPIRDLSGLSTVLAELVVGLRGGYTVAGAPLRTSGGASDVAFGQMMVGLRQNGTISVSALVTVVNHGFSGYVPKLAVNFAATH